jgi:hypothetical protein
VRAAGVDAGFWLPAGAPDYHAEGKDQHTEETVAGDQQDELPHVERERIPPALCCEISHRFVFRQTPFALAKAETVEQHRMSSLTGVG